jgi:hypothetical protein
MTMRKTPRGILITPPDDHEQKKEAPVAGTRAMVGTVTRESDG